MNTEYVETTETTTTSTAGSGITYNRLYLNSQPAYLKIAEIVLCLVTFICAAVDPWAIFGGGWVNFVMISAMITTLIFFIFHLFDIIQKLPGPWIFIEFMYYVIYCVLILVAAIVCASRASSGLGGIIAATVFSFLTLAVYGVDTFFQFQKWQGSQHHVTAAGSGTTVTTTTTTVESAHETRAQY